MSKKITLELDAEKLTMAQQRQVKSLVSLLDHVINTENEGEYFEGSAEIMRLCASIIKQAKFAANSEENNIPYADQAIEFSVDILQDFISESNVIRYDN